MYSLREKTASNVETFGIAEAAKILKKQRIPFSIAYWLIFGTAPKSRMAPPCADKDLCKGRNSAFRVAQYGAWLQRLGYSLSVR